MLLLERDAQNRRSCVIANSPQSQHLFPPRRKFASVFCDDLLRGLLLVALATVIADAAPPPLHFLSGRRGEGGAMGRAREIPIVSAYDRGDASALPRDRG